MTARVFAMYQRKPKSSIKHARQSLTPSDVAAKGEKFWVMEAQKSMHTDIEKRTVQTPVLQKKNTDRIYVVGGREKGGLRWVTTKMK